MRLIMTKSSYPRISGCSTSTRLRASPIAVTSSGVSMMYCVSGWFTAKEISISSVFPRFTMSRYTSICAVSKQGRRHLEEAVYQP